MRVVITANGEGSRMKDYKIPKFLLEYNKKPIIVHLLNTFPSAIILTHHKMDWLPIYQCEKTNSRKETLEYLKGWEKTLIVDCDIIVPDYKIIEHSCDTLYVKNNINAGLYYVENVSKLLNKMTGDDIVSGMIDYKKIEIKTIHLGTPLEYDNNCC